jgi:2-iminobutanoate/2-iminopropanoate deaminase
MSHHPRTVPADAGALPFPNAAVHDGLVVTGGHVAAFDPLAPDFETQVEQAMAALAQTLEEAGSSLEQVLRIECFLAGREHFDAWNAAYRRWFPTRRPPRTTLLAGFALDGLLVEVQALAAAQDDDMPATSRVVG